MSIFASVLKDIEKACFEANSWVAEYVPPEEVLHMTRSLYHMTLSQIT